MNLVLAEEGAVVNWSTLIGAGPAPGLRVHLIGAPYTPLHTSTLAVYLGVELTVSGYAPIALSSVGSDWTTIPIAQGAMSTNQACEWALGSACTIYGVFLELILPAKAWFGGIFDASIPIPVGGSAFYLVLSPTLISVP